METIAADVAPVGQIALGEDVVDLCLRAVAEFASRWY
jgi:hypothetical protein